MKSIEKMRKEIEQYPCNGDCDDRGCGSSVEKYCRVYDEFHAPADIVAEWHKALFPGQYKDDSIKTPTIKDSGERRSFDTGAVRDMATGKGDMVSLPNAAILRLSKHYEAGATKYGRWNYLKGLPVSSFMDSALRHLFKYLDGWDDEDHLAAAAFNVLGAMEMEAKHKELIDIPNREGKECFDYEGK